jgi:hypothetical protein
MNTRNTIRSLIAVRDHSESRPRRIVNALVLLLTVMYSFPQASTAFPANISTDEQLKEGTRLAGSIPLNKDTLDLQRFTQRNRTPVARRWYIFTSPDDDFTLAFPLKPNPERVEQGPVTLIRMFSLTTNDGNHFSVNFQDTGGDSRAPAKNEWAQAGDLEEMMSAADRKDGRQVVQTHRVGKNIVEMELWQTVPETGVHINYLRRSILRQGRVYTLACGSIVNGKAMNKSICRRFFNSFRFTKTQPLSIGQRKYR